MKKIGLYILLTAFTFDAISQEEEAKSKTFNFYIKSRDKATPAVFWISPEVSPKMAKDSNYEIKIGLKCPSKISEVEVKINGRSLSNSRGLGIVSSEKSSGEYDYWFNETISLAEGDNTIEVIAKNEFDAVTTEQRTIRFSNALVSRRDHALIFATDKYDNWQDLTNPINDAQTIAEQLENTYGFEVELIENNDIQDILLKVREYAAREYLDDDQLFVFFAGHGHYDDLLGDGYIVGKNSKKDDPANTSYLSFSILERALNNVPAKHVFLTMDVCFGGTFDSKMASNSRGSEDIYAEASRTEFASRRLKYKTRRFLTSGGKEYVSDGRPGMHSPFARKFIEALRTGGGKDRILTLSEILNEVSIVNPAPHYGEFGDNEAGSDFIFMVK
ncbi:MAG: caspase family protein [Bacteroidota bacterium]